MGREVKHIAIDLDDVTVDFVGGLLKSYELEFGEHIEVDADGTWGNGMVKFMKGTAKLAAAGYKSTWDWLRDREWLWATFPAISGAIGGIATLRNQGFYVEAVTSKPAWAEHNVWKWLGKWRPPFHRVTIINSKGGERKVDKTEADVMVDDKLATCMEFVEAGRKAIWFDRYDVQGVELPNNLWRARDWDGIIQAINFMAGRVS